MMNEVNEKNTELDPYEMEKGFSFDDAPVSDDGTAADAASAAEQSCAVADAECEDCNALGDGVKEAIAEAVRAEVARVLPDAVRHAVEEAVGAAPVKETPAEETPAEETPAEEAPAEEAPAKEAPAEAPQPDPLEGFKVLLDGHFQNLRSLIKYTKTKDETIQKLSGELQKYREDYCAKSFKSIATLLISFREDCRKSLSELGSFELTLEKAKKFISFLCDDYEELLSNAGCEEDDGEWSFNGKPLSFEERSEVKFPALFAAEEISEKEVLPEGDSMEAYLADAEDKIRRILASNEKLDKCLKDYCTLSTVIEQDVVLLSIYPPVRKMVSLYGKTRQIAEQCLEEINEENMTEHYRSVLTFLVERLEDILLCGGVTVDTTVDDTFDTKKNRLIKAVITEDAALDRKIAKQYTECYLMNGAVLAPAKVDVYKYQAQ